MAKNTTGLIQNKTTTPSERRKNAQKAGKASAEARVRRKTLREELLALLSDGNTQERMSVALIQKAKKGDVKAFETIRDTIGEKPIDKVMMSDVDPSVIAEVEKMVSDEL